MMGHMNNKSGQFHGKNIIEFVTYHNRFARMKYNRLTTRNLKNGKPIGNCHEFKIDEEHSKDTICEYNHWLYNQKNKEVKI